MAERLVKDKATEVPPPFRKRATPSVYSKVYSTDGCTARNRRAEQRRLRATGIEKLGDKEYKKLLEEIDQMSQTPVNIEELINKRMQEIGERLEAEEKEKEMEERQKTQNQDRPGTSKDTESVPARRSSPRKRKHDAETEKDGSKKVVKKPDPEPKVRQSEQIDIDDASKSWKGRVAKRPKQSKTAAIPMIMTTYKYWTIRLTKVTSWNRKRTMTTDTLLTMTTMTSRNCPRDHKNRQNLARSQR